MQLIEEKCMLGLSTAFDTVDLKVLVIATSHSTMWLQTMSSHYRMYSVQLHESYRASRSSTALLTTFNINCIDCLRSTALVAWDQLPVINYIDCLRSTTLTAWDQLHWLPEINYIDCLRSTTLTALDQLHWLPEINYSDCLRSAALTACDQLHWLSEINYIDCLRSTALIAWDQLHWL